jgi:hypothetical protein
MTQEDARAYLNYLLTLNLRQEEAFGPLALAFVKENDLGQPRFFLPNPNAIR